MKQRIGTNQTASELVRKIGKALRKPGLERTAVFGKEPGANVFAFSVDPSDSTKVLRESFDGTRTIGRMIEGRFRAIRSR